MKILITGTALCIVFLLFSCKKEAQVKFSITNSANKSPVAYAGDDQVILLPADSFRLQGNGTDTDGVIVKYEWAITAYYSQLLQSASFDYKSATATITKLTEGTYRCKLRVTDDRGSSATDEVIVRVISANCPCYPEPCDAVGDPCDRWDY